MAGALLVFGMDAGPAKALVSWATHTTSTREARLSGPVFGKSVKVAVVSGTIRVRDRGDRRFHRLRGKESILVGSSVDATKGKVRLTSAKKNGGKQSTVFFDGRFNVHQFRRGGLVDIKLEGGNFRACGSGARDAKAAPRTVRRLWGHGRGHTRTSGHSGSGTVRSTFWLTVDRCDGTFFKVKQGTVVVRDFTLHRTVILNAGEQYLAPAPGTVPPVQRTLTVTKSGSGAGIVTSSPAGIDCGATCSAQFADSTSVTLTAVAGSGSSFGSWTGCDSLSGSQCTVSMTANRTVTVTFTAVAPVQRTLTVTKAGSGAGIVTSSPAGIGCGAT